MQNDEINIVVHIPCCDKLIRASEMSCAVFEPHKIYCPFVVVAVRSESYTNRRNSTNTHRYSQFYKIQITSKSQIIVGWIKKKWTVMNYLNLSIIADTSTIIIVSNSMVHAYPIVLITVLFSFQYLLFPSLTSRNLNNYLHVILRFHCLSACRVVVYIIIILLCYCMYHVRYRNINNNKKKK